MPTSRCVLVALAIGVLMCAGQARAQEPDSPPDPRPQADHPAPENERPLHVGALVGTGFPRPLTVEAMVEMGDMIGVGAEYGVLPPVTVDGVQTSLWSLAGDARFFPFRDAFFVGLRAGRQHVDADTTITVSSYGSANEALALDAWFINPRVGFLWRLAGGLRVGMEAGVQIPFGTTTSSSLALALVPGAQRTADALVGSWLPTVDLLRIGMFF